MKVMFKVFRTSVPIVAWCLLTVTVRSTLGVKYLSDLIANLNKTCESLESWHNWMTPSKASLPPIGTGSQQVTVIDSCKKVPLDASGVYLFQPSPAVYPYPVYCDQDSFIGSHGWIVVQNRKENGQLSFDREWTEYRDGFGDPRSEFWIGLEKIYQLTKNDTKFELLVMLRKKNGKMEAARYATVSVGSEEDGYSLELGSYAFGSAGHTMEFSNKAKFSTPESNNDGTGKECAQQLRSGWWFSDCDNLPILKRDPYHKRSLTVQIGCLMELKDYNKLFYVAHKLVDFYPDDAISWYAVGCYYDLIGKSDPARRYLSKATTLDRLYGPAWLAYGHSFAKENEHDQAMAAYFKATQLMRGCHLPLLYIGVECGLTKNLEMAEKFFYQAMAIAPLDVYVLHELGVLKFEYELYESAEEVFRTTLDMVQSMAKANREPISIRWEPLLNNLGHCCRKNKKYEEALEFHQRALFLKPLSASTYTAIGYVHALMGSLDEAVESFHKSLSLRRDDVFTITILKYVIEDLAEEAPLPFHDEGEEGEQEKDGEDEEGDDTRADDEMDEDGKSMAPGGGNGTPADAVPVRLKLKFDEYDSNASPVSDTSADDMSMDL